MNRLPLLLCFWLISGPLLAQHSILPRGFAAGEEALMPAYIHQLRSRNLSCAVDLPPTNLRAMAEWEELQAIVITWTSFPAILTEIVRYAREECEVIIICTNQVNVQNTLTNASVDWSTNVRFIEDDFDSIWVRDYGPNSVYANEIDSLLLVDWIYNRPRPRDDQVPAAVAEFLGIPLYCTTTVPNDLVHTGGNFMADGLGTGFSSRLVLDENDASNQWGTSNHSEPDIDAIMQHFMGITNYPKMTVLPYDAIHHIDMHMKLLDEETLLVGEYPEGVADGPQIEANIQYVLNNFSTVYGKPLKVIRMPMPPDGNNQYPDDSFWADYRTYTNSLIVNKTILVPIYEERYDTTALRIWRESMPGYKIVGIDCNAIIPLSGALHCITKEIGVSDPLWITHSKTVEACNGLTVPIEAQIKHRSGIATAKLFYSIDPTNESFTSIDMQTTGNDMWIAELPAQPFGVKMHYYIEAEAHSGKTIHRPMTAPEGFWTYEVLECTVSANELTTPSLQLQAAFPNPAKAITCIPIEAANSISASLVLEDIFGRKQQIIFEGTISKGKTHYFIDAAQFAAGTYIIRLSTKHGQQSQKLIIH